MATLPDYRNQSEMRYGERCPKLAHMGCAVAIHLNTIKQKMLFVNQWVLAMFIGGLTQELIHLILAWMNGKTADFVCEYINRPPTVEEYCEDMLMMSIFYSVEMYPEFNIDHVKRHLRHVGIRLFETRNED